MTGPHKGPKTVDPKPAEAYHGAREAGFMAF